MQTQKEWENTVDSRNTLINYIKKTVKKLNDGSIEEAEDDNNHHQALSIDTKTVKTILLTCGGPSVGIDLTFNEYNEVIKGEYWSTEHTGGNTVTVEIWEEDLEAIMQVYGLEY